MCRARGVAQALRFGVTVDDGEFAYEVHWELECDGGEAQRSSRGVVGDVTVTSRRRCGTVRPPVRAESLRAATPLCVAFVTPRDIATRSEGQRLTDDRLRR